MIPVAEPSLSVKETEYVQRAIITGWVSGGGEWVERFEEMVAKAVGRRWAVATLSGTMALHVALDAVGTKPGHTVEMPSLTFCAAANALSWIGATPHFVDIEKNWSPDFSWIGSDVFDAAPAIARQHWPNWWRVPWKTECAILSFNGNKTITTGQGGAVVGDDDDLRRQVLHLANLAKVRDYQVSEIGYNARMANVNAAIGCAQMERLEEFRGCKDSIMRRYKTAGLSLQASAWMALWQIPQDVTRESAILHLEDAGIAARPFWQP
ncbi:MAG: DegT/DnrJ/EryC1/StrS family aminotransferase, partial [Geminicoccaceae bacterium]